MKMILHALKLIFAIVLAISLAACSSDNDNPKDVGGDEPPDINGNWITGCNYDQEKNIGRKVAFTFLGGSFSSVFSNYSDSSCTQFKEQSLSEGTISIKENLITASGEEASKIDLQFKDGRIWESLVANKDGTLHLNPDMDGAGRPNDLNAALVFSREPPINIDGDWTTDCRVDDNRWVILTLRIRESHFGESVSIYSDSLCSQLTAQDLFAGRIDFGSKLTTPSGKTAQQMDLRYNDGDVWENLITKENDRLYIHFDQKFGINGVGRPEDLEGAVEYSHEPSVDIDGKWITDCTDNEEGGFTLLFDVSKERFSLTVNEYSDNSCSQSEAKTPNKGGITYGEELTTPSGRTAHEIDLRFDDGKIWESLVERQGDRLYLKSDLKGDGRPDNLVSAIEFKEQ